MTLLGALTCTDTLDRDKITETILKVRGDIKSGRPHHVLKAHQKPQIIWCASPQTAITAIKIIMSMIRDEDPQQQSNRLSIHPSQWRRISSRGLTGVWPIVEAAIEFNPPIELYGWSGNKVRYNFAEIALNNIDPELGKIDLSKLKGSRPPLSRIYYGQFSTSDTIPATFAELCGPIWDYGDLVFVCERPVTFHYETISTRMNVFARDSRIVRATPLGDIRLHNTEGPAIQWRDGFSIHAIHGVAVPGYVVEEPHKINVYKINHELNAEVRRIMIDRYKLGKPVSGAAAFVLDAGGKRIDHDERWGTLWYLEQNIRSTVEEEDLVVLEVVNRTPEPDGTFKHYFLRVPPHIRRAYDAAAWTFGIDTTNSLDVYNPQSET